MKATGTGRKSLGLMLLLYTLSCDVGTVTPPALPLPGEPFVIVGGSSYSGAIIPEAYARSGPQLVKGVAGYWTPSPATVGTLESKLNAALQLGEADPRRLVSRSELTDSARDYYAGAITHVLERLLESRRQYFGLIMPDGSKRILVSGFPEDMSQPGQVPSWRLRVVLVADGGSAFWRVQYHLADGRFTDFEVNGSG